MITLFGILISYIIGKLCVNTLIDVFGVMSPVTHSLVALIFVSVAYTCVIRLRKFTNSPFSFVAAMSAGTLAPFVLVSNGVIGTAVGEMEMDLIAALFIYVTYCATLCSVTAAVLLEKVKSKPDGYSNCADEIVTGVKICRVGSVWSIITLPIMFLADAVSVVDVIMVGLYSVIAFTTATVVYVKALRYTTTESMVEEVIASLREKNQTITGCSKLTHSFLLSLAIVLVFGQALGAQTPLFMFSAVLTSILGTFLCAADIKFLRSYGHTYTPADFYIR